MSIGRLLGAALSLALSGAAACTGTITAEGPGGGGGGGGGPDGGGPGGPDGAGVAGSLRIGVVSDLNGSYGSTTYESSVHAGVAALIARAPDIVISTGDMVAGQMGGLDYLGMWGGFHAAVSDPLAAAGIPFAVTPGNHDGSEYGGFELERQVFVDQWNARRPVVDFLDDSAYPLRYSYTRGPVLFISLDATGVGPYSPDERAWVASQLEAGADRPVKIVYGHVPLHPFTQGRETEVTGDTELEAILVSHGVSLYVSGHHHAYYPGRHDALRVLSTACMGSGSRELIGTASVSPRGFEVIEVVDGVLTSVEGYTGPDWGAPIPRAALPGSLSYGAVTVVRDDL